MMVYNFNTGTGRYAKIARFVDAFLTNLDQLQKAPRHPRWQDVNLTATVSGLQRFAPVTQWLRNNPVPVPNVRTAGKRSLRKQFETFIEAQASAGRTEELLRSSKADLFKRFVAWRKGGRLVKKSAQPKSKPKRSLRVLFQQFIASEVARIGKSNVLALSKPELYRRFLQWRKTGGVVAVASARPVLAKKPKPKRSLRALFQQFIAAEVARIGRSNVLALSKPELYRRFLEWRKGGRDVAVASVQPRKKPRSKRSLRALFQQFIAAEVARIGKSNVLALSKPELYRRFLSWRKGGSTAVAAATQRKPKSKPSLRVLFRRFIDEEVARVGRDNVRTTSKPELFRRFLSWRKRIAAN